MLDLIPGPSPMERGAEQGRNYSLLIRLAPLAPCGRGAGGEGFQNMFSLSYGEAPRVRCSKCGDEVKII